MWALGGKRTTQQTATGRRAYYRWCVITGTPTSVPSTALDAQNRIADYIFELGPIGGLTVGTVRKYVSAVHSWWRLVNPSVAPEAGATSGMHILAIARYAETDRRLKQNYQAVDTALLLAVFNDTNPSLEIRAAILFGYAYVCRSGEFVQAESSTDWARNLVRYDDVDFMEDAQGRAIRVTFYHRKNNQSSVGSAQVVIRRELPDKALCVVAAMFELRDARRARGVGDPPGDGPIFLRHDGKPLAASDVAAALRAGAVAAGRSTEHLSTYSLRVGAATQMARAGLSEVSIMLAGGWASASGMRGYIRHIAEDTAYFGEVLADEDPLARAARTGARPAAAPAAKRARSG